MDNKALIAAVRVKTDEVSSISFDLGEQDKQGREKGIRVRIEKISIRAKEESENASYYSVSEQALKNGFFYKVVPVTLRDGKPWGASLNGTLVDSFDEAVASQTKILKKKGVKVEQA